MRVTSRISSASSPSFCVLKWLKIKVDDSFCFFICHCFLKHLTVICNNLQGRTSNTHRSFKFVSFMHTDLSKVFPLQDKILNHDLYSLNTPPHFQHSWSSYLPFANTQMLAYLKLSFSNFTASCSSVLCWLPASRVKLWYGWYILIFHKDCQIFHKLMITILVLYQVTCFQ